MSWDNSAYLRKRRERLIKNGLCVDCGKPARPALTTCKDCAVKHAAYSALRDHNADRRARIEAGLCTSCASPAEPGRTQCADCAAQKRADWAERVEARICPRCGKPADRDVTTCKICRESERKRAAANYARKRKNKE